MVEANKKLHKAYAEDKQDFHAFPKWNVTQQVAEDLSELSVTLTEREYRFNLLYNSNRPYNKEDLRNISEAHSLMTSIWRKVRMFSPNDTIKDDLDKFRTEFKYLLLKNPRELPESIFAQFNKLLEDFYPWWHKTQTYYLSDMNVKTKKRLF